MPHLLRISERALSTIGNQQNQRADGRSRWIKCRASRTQQPKASPRRLLEGLFEHAPTVFQLFDLDGRSVAVNHTFRALFGSEPPPDYSVRKERSRIRVRPARSPRRLRAGRTSRRCRGDALPHSMTCGDASAGLVPPVKSMVGSCEWRRPECKARGGVILVVWQRRATQQSGMHTLANAGQTFDGRH